MTLMLPDIVQVCMKFESFIIIKGLIHSYHTFRIGLLKSLQKAGKEQSYFKVSLVSRVAFDIVTLIFSVVFPVFEELWIKNTHCSKHLKAQYVGFSAT